MKREKISEEERLYLMTEYERPYWDRGEYVAGMDEVGRGPLAGPVVTACVIMPSEPLIAGVNDSKKLSEKKREQLSPIIMSTALSYRIEYVSNEIIDELNIAEATKLCFKKSYDGMSIKCENVLIDFVKGLEIDARQTPLVHGDAISYTIAAASVIAKVERDRYMMLMHEKYPMYNFAKNKGYGTQEHIEALRKYGPCPIHRRSFIGNFI